MKIVLLSFFLIASFLPIFGAEDNLAVSEARYKAVVSDVFAHHCSNEIWENFGQKEKIYHVLRNAMAVVQAPNEKIMNCYDKDHLYFAIINLYSILITARDAIESNELLVFRPLKETQSMGALTFSTLTMRRLGSWSDKPAKRAVVPLLVGSQKKVEQKEQEHRFKVGGRIKAEPLVFLFRF